MKTILVTGGAGFIGSHLVTKLLDQGNKVVVIDNFSTTRRNRLDHVRNKVTFIEGDIRNPQDLTHCLKIGIDAIAHLAGQSSVRLSLEQPMHSADVNILGTLDLLNEATKAGVQRFVFASTAGLYKESADKAIDEQYDIKPYSPYAVEKLSCEYYLGAWEFLHAIQPITLRLFNVYGESDDGPFACAPSKFSAMLKSGKQPALIGDGLNTRDFVYIDDVVSAIILSLHAPQEVSGQTFNIGSGERTTILNLLQMMSSCAGMKFNPEKRKATKGENPHSLANISKAQHLLGWHPQVSLEEGVHRLMYS